MSGRPDFNAVARPYRWLEYMVFGHALERAREQTIPQLAHATSALVLGDGDGRFLAKLFAANPAVSADAVDSSAAMLQLLEDRCKPYQNRLRLRHVDALDFIPGRTHDLICTHFFLDCLTQSEVERLTARLVPALQGRDAAWLVSDFRVPPAGLAHWLARAFIRALYFAFRIFTGLRVTHSPDYANALTAQGLMLRHRHLSLGGLLTTELWQRKRP